MRSSLGTRKLHAQLLDPAWNGDLGKALRFSSLATIQTYGSAGASTINAAGLGARHHEISWNNVRFNSPFLGLGDLSLLPTFFVDQASEVTGSGGAFHGSGSFTGLTQLGSSPQGKTQILAGVGAFGRRQGGVKTGFYLLKGMADVRLWAEKSDNDHTFRDPFSGRKDNLKFNEQDKGGGAFAWRKISNRQVWQVGGLFLGSKNRLPGPIVAPTDSTWQLDQNVLVYANGMYSLGPFNLSTFTNYHFSRLDFDDFRINLASNAKSHRLTQNVKLDWKATDFFRFWALSELGQTWALTNNFEQTRRRSQITAAGGMVWNPFYFLELEPAFRIEQYSDFGSAMLYDFTLRIFPVKRITLELHAGTNFLPPTLNDLYWNPGGNPDLNPERGWVLEAFGRFGIVENERLRAQINLGLSRRVLDEGIRWINQGGNLWSPINIDELESKGWDVATDWALFFGRTQVSLRSTLEKQIVRSTKARFNGDQTVNKQLVFVPEWQSKHIVQAKYESTQLQLLAAYQSRRYSTGDHRNPLDPLGAFWLLDAGIEQSFWIKKAQLKTILTIKNIGATDYEIIRWFPMPGRHLQLSLTLNL